MKILVVSTVRYRRNGIATVIENLFTDDAFAGEDVSFLFPLDNEGDMVKKLTDRGFRVHTASRKTRALPAYFLGLYRLMRRERFDLIHVHGNSSTLAVELLAAWLAGCRVRLAHSHSTKCASLAVHRLLSPLFQALCTHRLACGTDAGRWLYGSRDFTVVNNGIRTARYAFRQEDRDCLRRELGIEPEQTLIGHVGILNENKNQSFLIDILKRLPRQYRLLLMGEGPAREALERKAADLGDRVIFTGSTDRVPRFLSACDLIVMPSVYEGLPLTLIEEQANGLVCLVSDSITREADKTGNVRFLPLSAGADHWAEQVRSVELTPDRRARSEQAVEKIRACGCDIQTEAEKLLACYRAAAKREDR